MKLGLNQNLSETLLREISKLYSLNYSTLSKIDTYENFIYQGKGNEKDVIIRISHSSYRTIELIKAEIDWIEYLNALKLPIVKVIKSINDNLVEKVLLEDKNYFSIAGFEKAEGETIVKDQNLLTNSIIEHWGALQGKLHNVSKDYKPKNNLKRNEWFEEREVIELDTYLKDYPKILSKAKKLLKEIQALPKRKDTFGIIHNDLHETNILVTEEGKITVIDFDDCQYDYFVSDFASTLFQIAWRFHSKEKTREQVILEFFPKYMKGYLKERKIDEYWFSKLPLFLELRHIKLLVTLLIERNIEKDEWGEGIIKSWLEMFEKDQKWIEIDFVEVFRRL